MNKQIQSILLAVLMLLSSVGLASANNPVVIIDGIQLNSDIPPVIENGRTLVPLRSIFEALGAEVQWDEPSRTVTGTKGDTVIKLTIDGKYAFKNGLGIQLDVPAKVINNRTMVPLRFISDSFQASVEWDNETETVNITTKPIITLEENNPNKGKIVYPSGFMYEGDIIDGLRNGIGTYTYSYGSTYSGEWKDDKRNGQGTSNWPGYGTYTGQFENDQRNGQGTFVYEDGTKYSGYWKNDLMDGQGTMTYTNGANYQGNWSMNMYNGQGTYTWADGDQYTGNYINGLRSGQGTLYFNSGIFQGDKYVGSWANDAGNGQGTYYWHVGSRWEGPFSNSKPNGIGTLYTPSGLAFSLQYVNGKALTNNSTSNNLSISDTLVTTGVVESRIDGTFEGWDGDTIFQLTNGQIWQQSSFSSLYNYAFSPKVTIYPDAGGYKMHVEGVSKDIQVVRLR